MAQTSYYSVVDAIHTGDVKFVREILDQKGNPNEIKYGFPALREAFPFHEDIAALLLEQKAKLEWFDIRVAIATNVNVKIIECLLENGVSPNERLIDPQWCGNHITPIELAINFKRTDHQEVLEKAHKFEQTKDN